MLKRKRTESRDKAKAKRVEKEMTTDTCSMCMHKAFSIFNRFQ